MNATIELSADEMDRLASLMFDAAAAAGDDGREGCPDELLWVKAARQIRRQTPKEYER